MATTYVRVLPDDPDVAEYRLLTDVINAGRIDTLDPSIIVELAQLLGVSTDTILNTDFHLELTP